MNLEIHNLVPSMRDYDELMLEAKLLYDRSFPPAELHDFGEIRTLIEQADGVRHDHVLVAADGPQVHGLSIFRYAAPVRLGYLWYLCVDQTARGTGLGSRLYAETLDVLMRHGKDGGATPRGMIFEVDPLNTEPDAAFGHPVRRVRFYERLGARLMLGYGYVQPPIGPHGPVPLELMFHPFGRPQEDYTGHDLAAVIHDFLLHFRGNDEEIPTHVHFGTIEEALAETKTFQTE